VKLTPSKRLLGCVVAAAAVAVAVVVTDLLAAGGGGASSCTRYAAPSGSNRGSGRSAAPFKNVATLIRRLAPGQVGCLRRGVYNGDVAIRKNGIMLRSAPNQHATIVGVLEITGDHVTVQGLTLDGVNATATPGVQINGDHVVLRGNDITNRHTAICVVVGGNGERWGIAHETVVDSNRIHGCGRLPPTNQDHGIYLDTTRDAHVLNNLITDTADFAVHIYPDSQGAVVEHNVIVGNGMGVIFAGDTRTASSDNVVRSNVIADSKRQYNVESWWAGTKGSDNTLTQNCLWNGAEGNIDASQGGFSAGDNVVADPLFVDPAHGNYHLRSGSPCAGMGLP
jgi:nitrous oxidase accessory protein NosD